MTLPSNGKFHTIFFIHFLVTFYAFGGLMTDERWVSWITTLGSCETCLGPPLVCLTCPESPLLGITMTEEEDVSSAPSWWSCACSADWELASGRVLRLSG